MNDSGRIADLKKEMDRCHPSWNTYVLPMLGFGAIGAYLGNQTSDPVILIGGIIAALWGTYWWVIMRRLYKKISAVYEAELDAAESHR
ncbi:MAG TPA: hypothetical protein EYN79_10720 [Planctomycetes bacterium]|nr:hypothetical protein [Planctomycetota bacterium]HIN79596.1 hypothetical protein [Planctomycetota bacterium]